MEFFNPPLITALSTLCAVGLTLFFTNRRERSKFHQDILLKELRDTEQFYIDVVENIHSYVRELQERGSEDNASGINSSIIAKLSLKAPKEIISKYSEIQQYIRKWEPINRKVKALKDQDKMPATPENLILLEELAAAYQDYFGQMKDFVNLAKTEIEQKRSALIK